MRKGLTTTHKRLIFILSGVLVLLLTFFLIFQKNMDRVSELENSNTKLQGQINFLSNLQIKVNQKKETSDQKLKKIEKYGREPP